MYSYSSPGKIRSRDLWFIRSSHYHRFLGLLETGSNVTVLTEEFNVSRFGKEEDHKDQKLKTLITHLQFGMLFQAIERDKEY